VWGRYTFSKVPKFISCQHLFTPQSEDLLWVSRGNGYIMRKFLQKTISIALMGLMLAAPLLLSAQGKKKKGGGGAGGGRGGARKKAGIRKKGGK
jgi:hypothetical protein